MMPCVGMVGTTYKQSDQTTIAALTLQDDESIIKLHDACGLVESVYVATCNRVEIIFMHSPSGSVAQCREHIYRYFCQYHPWPSEQTAEQILFAYRGDGAVERLLHVAAAVDSMVPGETQILGQIKQAFHRAQSLGLVGTGLQAIFNVALKAAKRVRLETRLTRGHVSLLTVAKESIQTALRQGQKRLVIVGSGEMATQCLKMLAEQTDLQIWIVSRSLERAQALAQQYRGQALSQQAFFHKPLPCDVLLAATKATTPLLHHAFFQQLTAHSFPLLVDIGVQRIIDVEAAQAFGLPLLDLDRLEKLAMQAKTERYAELAAARMVLDEELEWYCRKVAIKISTPAVRALRKYVENIVQRVLLSPAAEGMRPSAEQVALAHRLTNQILHKPTVALKELAVEYGEEILLTFVQALCHESSL